MLALMFCQSLLFAIEVSADNHLPASQDPHHQGLSDDYCLGIECLADSDITSDQQNLNISPADVDDCDNCCHCHGHGSHIALPGRAIAMSAALPTSLVLDRYFDLPISQPTSIDRPPIA